METLLQDLRFAFRALARSPSFTLVAAITLALGIGANTAIFSVVYGVLLRPLPYPHAERLVGLSQVSPGYRGGMAVNFSQFRFIEEQSRVFAHVAASTSVGLNLVSGDAADRVTALRVSKDYFRVLGVAPRLGREFLAEEDRPGGPHAVVLSQGLWLRRFGGDPGVIGRTLLLDAEPYIVVGVMPAGFQSQPAVDLWTTLAQVAATVGSGRNLALIGRLKPELPIAQAKADLQTTVAEFRRAFRSSVPPDIGIELHPYQALVVNDVQAPVKILFGAIGLVLLIACANVASLTFGRAATRGREFALRMALGATRRRLIRQLLTESLVLAFVGGALGLVFAGWGLSVLLSLVPADLPRAADIHLDRWTLAFTFAVSWCTGVAFGLAPAWRAARRDPHDTLSEGSGRSTSAARQGRLRNLLVVGEIALSLVLLVGAGLLIRTFANLFHTDPGFDTSRVVSAEIWVTGSRYEGAPAISSFYQDLTRRITALPGVAQAAVVEAGLPLERGGNVAVSVEGGRQLPTDYRTVTPGYFETLDIPLVQGRTLTTGDATAGAPVVVVNESFARRYLDDGNALGRTLQLEGRSDAPRRVVGVVRDVKSFIGFPAQPTVFIPSAQTPLAFTQVFSSWFPMHVIVRTAGDPAVVQAALARVIHDADPHVPVGGCARCRRCCRHRSRCRASSCCCSARSPCWRWRWRRWACTA
jgi:predicted permease